MTTHHYDRAGHRCMNFRPLCACVAPVLADIAAQVDDAKQALARQCSAGDQAQGGVLQPSPSLKTG